MRFSGRTGFRRRANARWAVHSRSSSVVKERDDGKWAERNVRCFERLAPSTALIQVHIFAWGGLSVCDGGHCVDVMKKGAELGAIKSMRENSVVPPGLHSLFPRFPQR